MDDDIESYITKAFLELEAIQRGIDDRQGLWMSKHVAKRYN